MKMVITLKSGTQVRVDVTEFSTGTSELTGDLRRLKWVTPDGWQSKLHHVDVEQIAAIHTEDNPAVPPFPHAADFTAIPEDEPA